MKLLIKCITGPKFLHQFELAAEGRPSAELQELSFISTLRLALLLHIPGSFMFEFGSRTENWPVQENASMSSQSRDHFLPHLFQLNIQYSSYPSTLVSVNI